MSRTVQLAFALQLAGVCMAAEPIGILFDFANQPEPAVVDLMKSEIRAILAPAQLDLTFQRLGQSGATQAFRKIVIVRFQGSCESRLDTTGSILDAPAIDLPALGETDVSAGHVLPFVHVYCNEVRGFVPRVSRIPYAQMYGRALGRVVAHELYHALLSTRDHTRTGVARFTQTARDLTRDKLPLDPLSIGLLRELYGPKGKEGGSVEPPSELGLTVAGARSVNQP